MQSFAASLAFLWVV